MAGIKPPSQTRFGGFLLPILIRNAISETDKTMVEYPCRGFTIGREQNIKSLRVIQWLVKRTHLIFFYVFNEHIGMQDDKVCRLAGFEREHSASF